RVTLVVRLINGQPADTFSAPLFGLDRVERDPGAAPHGAKDRVGDHVVLLTEEELQLLQSLATLDALEADGLDTFLAFLSRDASPSAHLVAGCPEQEDRGTALYLSVLHSTVAEFRHRPSPSRTACSLVAWM